MIVSMRTCRVLASVLVLFVMYGTVAGQPPPQQDETQIPTKEYAQTYSQSFKGSDIKPDGWRFISRLSEECVRFEETGLRITLPAGGPEQGQTAGIRSAFGVKGDFEITLSFEALNDPDPADVGKGGTRFTLSVNLDTPLLDTPQAEVATLNRSMVTKGFTTWARTRHRPAPFSHSFPTPATTGRLRMVRSGDDVYYLASVALEQPFVFLKKYRFGAEDLQRIGISGSTGGAKASLDMRVTDFRIRADGIPNAPPADEAEKHVNAITPVLEGGGKEWWIVPVLIVAFVIVALVMVAFFWRACAGATKRPTAETRNSESFNCPNCGKALKAKTALAGKKVKCPHCGATAPVPKIEVDQAGLTA